jgi:membrane fusion protein, heavy metal efflux system
MKMKHMIEATLCALIVIIGYGCSSEERGADHESRDRSSEAAKDEHAHEENEHSSAEDGHRDESHADAHGHEEGEDLARIDPATAKEHGIEVSEAGPATIAEAVTLTGRLIIDPRRESQVRARFPGPVKRVHKDVGSQVQKGEVLAEVESNESLTVYEVRSPISGVVLERMTNVGDVALDNPLFRIGDTSALQAELRAFSRDQDKIRSGANAIVEIRGQEVPGTVLSLVPELDTRTQALRVRVQLDPGSTLQSTPGQFATARVLVGDGSEAAVTVQLASIQRLEGREVIFVPEADGFAARDVVLGRRDDNLAEIVEGLKAGESYVSAGAFLLKAEIGKHSAGHDH